MDKSVSIIIPAFNEQDNIVAAINNVDQVLSECTRDYEIIVVNDGSTDNTLSNARQASEGRSRIKLLSNEANRGFGYSYRRGVAEATKQYISLFPGDNDMSSLVLKDLVRELTGVDLVITYLADMRNRTWGRRIISRLFVMLMNTLFQLNLKYYNGPFICELKALRAADLKSDGLAMVAELVVKLIRSGCQYKQIPLEHTGRKNQHSKALSLKSVWAVLSTLRVLFAEIHFSARYKKALHV